MGAPQGYRTEAPPVGAVPMGQPGGGAGGSFLGTAAATAAGVIGGTLLMNSMRSMMGGHGGSAHAAADPFGSGSSPWSSGSSSGNSELARQAGIDDIGRGSGSREGAGADRGHGLVDSDAGSAAPREETGDDGNYAEADQQFEDDGDDFGDDMGGGDFGGGSDE